MRIKCPPLAPCPRRCGSRVLSARAGAQSWMQARNVPKVRKVRVAVHTIPDLQDYALPRRKTRSEIEKEEEDAALEDQRKGLAPVPEMLLTAEDRRVMTFESTNASVVDPIEEELTRSMVNVWSEEEKQVFMEKLVDFSLRPEREMLKKNFYAISHFLPNKTTRDCVQFYYMNKKTKYFKQMYKKFELKNRKSYSLKNKYRNRDDSNQMSFSETYAIGDARSYVRCTFACTLPETSDAPSSSKD
jgi:hypothetical protein